MRSLGSGHSHIHVQQPLMRSLRPGHSHIHVQQVCGGSVLNLMAPSPFILTLHHRSGRSD
jgi:hypothetical protein